MIAYILRRLVMLVPVLIVVGVVVFGLVHLTPGDPAAVMLGDRATPEDIARLRDQLGLNDPLPVQFVRWFSNVLRLDFGESIFLGEPVTQALLDRMQPTVLLTVYALSIEVLIGIPAGVIAAVRYNSPLDRSLTVVAISGSAIPTFFLGILLILIFSVRLRWLPSGGYVPFGEDPAAHFKAMLLPAFALGFSAAGLLARLVRSSMLDVLREDYVRTAFAKGLPEQLVIVRHALRNALIPALTIIASRSGLFWEAPPSPRPSLPSRGWDASSCRASPAATIRSSRARSSPSP